MWYPLTFHPQFKERLWGGRRLAGLFGKDLPPGAVIGESWEICDRPEAVSIVSAGPLAGTTLRGLMRTHGSEIMGRKVGVEEQFPWLCKLLDARDDLSLQVHPPAALAPTLGGEAKAELWYVALADPGAAIYAGVQPGVTRAVFADRATQGALTGCFHRLPVTAGDVLFLPSGRLHALGAGLVVFEIQQNSDTTYRVFDWNRVGGDGQRRELHLEPALESIDFSDSAPALVPREMRREGACSVRQLVDDPLFHIEEVWGEGASRDRRAPGQPGVIAEVKGHVRITGGERAVVLGPGEFALLPAALDAAGFETAGGPATWLSTTPG